MALQLIYGSSGSGKTEYLYTRLVEQAQKNPDKRFYFVVPEQFTMQTQSALVRRSRGHVLTNMDVTSFRRLAFRIFGELGRDYTVLEETGKSLVIRRLAAEHASELAVLGARLKKPGYIDQVKSVLSEMMNYAVTPQELKELSNAVGESGLLAYKLGDISVLYEAFQAYLGEERITAESRMEVLAEHAQESALLADAVLVLDGFTGFTPVQYKFLRKLLRIAQQVTVSVTIDPAQFHRPARMEDVFYTSRHTVQTLTRMADEEDCVWTEPICVKAGQNSRLSSSAELSHLEQNLFRPSAVKYQGETEDITVFAAPNATVELTYILQTIHRMVRDEGMHYSDFAIVTGAADTYARYAESLFQKYEIPYFIDRKDTILFHPLTELIRGLFEVMTKDYSAEAVLRVLKTGLAGFGREEVDILENYLLARNIRGYHMWHTGFRYPRKHNKRIAGDEERMARELEVVNELRKRFTELTDPLAGLCRGRSFTVREMVRELYQLLVRLDIESVMRKRKDEYEQAGRMEMASVYGQIYRIMIDLLDKYVELLGDERMDAEEFAAILDAGIETSHVGMLPPKSDCVILGDIERTRVSDVRVLFFAGVNDGVIPGGGRGSLLSEMDRERLKNLGLELAPGRTDEAFLQRFYLYLTMTKPSKELFVSFSHTASDGSAQRPSYLIHELESLFPKMRIREIAEDDCTELVTPYASLDLYIRGLQKEYAGDAWSALSAWYQKQPKWKETMQEMADRAQGFQQSEELSKKSAEDLFGKEIRGSVSRLESFASCPYKHFLDYGLKLSEREIYQMSAADRGSFLHDAVHEFSIRVERLGGWTEDWAEKGCLPRHWDSSLSGWNRLHDADYEDLIRDTMQAMREKGMDSFFHDSASNEFMLTQIRRELLSSAQAIAYQIQHGHYRPMAYESRFRYEEPADSGRSVILTGIIDRVDVYERDGKRYFRVIDYKSGDEKFNLVWFYEGVSLQLPLYMRAWQQEQGRRQGNPEAAAAGLFYFHLDNPIVKEEDAGSGDLYREVLKEYKLTGPILKDPGIIRDMDIDLDGIIIPAGITKSGKINENSSKQARKKEDMQRLSDKAGRHVRELSERILSGDIRVYPYQESNRESEKNACRYCKCRAVCGYEERYFLKRKPVENNQARIMEKIREEQENDG